MSTEVAQQFDCKICFGSNLSGLSCPQDPIHFICTDCFSSYVHTLCEESCRLYESCGYIKCPFPGCSSQPWSYEQFVSILSPSAMKMYVDVLLRPLQKFDHTEDPKKGLSRKEWDVDQILNALILFCPNTLCHAALDPNPDGCCAMKCMTCGQNFCWLCFSLQNDGNSCHKHVRFCERNPNPGRVFLNTNIVQTAQKVHRINSLRAKLKAVANGGTGIGYAASSDNFHPATDDLWKSKRFRKAAAACESILQNCRIFPDEIFNDIDYSLELRPDLLVPEKGFKPWDGQVTADLQYFILLAEMVLGFISCLSTTTESLSSLMSTRSFAEETTATLASKPVPTYVITACVVVFGLLLGISPRVQRVVLTLPQLLNTALLLCVLRGAYIILKVCLYFKLAYMSTMGALIATITFAVMNHIAHSQDYEKLIVFDVHLGGLLVMELCVINLPSTRAWLAL